jgi:hypothetical protein
MDDVVWSAMRLTPSGAQIPPSGQAEVVYSCESPRGSSGSCFLGSGPLCDYADVTGTGDAWQVAAAFEVLTIPRMFPRMDHPAAAGSRGAIVPSRE